jgi:hypothetical protein
MATSPGFFSYGILTGEALRLFSVLLNDNAFEAERSA